MRGSILLHVYLSDGTSPAQSFRDKVAVEISPFDVSASAPSTGVPSVPSRINNLREEEWSFVKLSQVRGNSKSAEYFYEVSINCTKVRVSLLTFLNFGNL